MYVKMPPIVNVADEESLTVVLAGVDDQTFVWMSFTEKGREFSCFEFKMNESELDRVVDTLLHAKGLLQAARLASETK